MNHKRAYWREKQKRAVQRLHELARRREMYLRFMEKPDPVMETTLDHAADKARRATQGLERTRE